VRIEFDGSRDIGRPDAAPDPRERMVLERAQNGDGDAFRELVEEHHRQIYRLAMRVLNCDRNTAEDLCQEVFLRAYRGLARFDGGVRFGAWLHTIAMNACISEYRKRRALKRDRPTLSIDAPLAGHEDLHIEPPSREVDPGARADQREFALAVREAVARLPEEFRHAVLLRDMQQLSYEEIADILEVPPGTVRSRIHRGRLLLQQMLEGFEP
jgi:RNA polymerase sigma-70 factor (ECF subfamily)